MHGLGNDYLFVFGDVPENITDICKKLSDRHFGVGSDGMIYISNSDVADFKMRIFNADGSEAMMCGNGIRCVGKYVFDIGYTDKTSISVETLSGVKNLDLHTEAGKVRAASVGMGKAAVAGDFEIPIGNEFVKGTPVSVGNPHFVIFVGDAESAPVDTAGPLIEKNDAFPGGVNVEFVQLIAPNELRMRVWERGSGVTMACGTGASASVSAAVNKGFCSFDEPVRVHLDGGDLEIIVSRDYGITMTGPSETVYEGDCDLC